MRAIELVASGIRNASVSKIRYRTSGIRRPFLLGCLCAQWLHFLGKALGWVTELLLIQAGMGFFPSFGFPYENAFYS